MQVNSFICKILLLGLIRNSKLHPLNLVNKKDNKIKQLESNQIVLKDSQNRRFKKWNEQSED